VAMNSVGMMYRGQVTSIDRTANRLVVNGKDGETTYDISKARINGTVEPNHYVTVTYTQSADGLVVAASASALHGVASIHVNRRDRLETENEQHMSGPW